MINTEVQTVDVTAEFSYSSAIDFIKFLLENGFSVTAEKGDGTWEVIANRPRAKAKANPQ